MKDWIQLTTRLRAWFIGVAGRLCHRDHPPGMPDCRHVVDLIMAYLEGTLEPDERRAFEAHIADCQNCWHFLRSYRETITLGQQLRVEEIPADVHERLETFLRDRLHPSA